VETLLRVFVTVSGEIVHRIVVDDAARAETLRRIQEDAAKIDRAAETLGAAAEQLGGVAPAPPSSGEK
jgi:hypothetical protein